MPFVRGMFAEALAPGLNMRTFNTYRERPEIYRSLVNVKDSKLAFEQDIAYAGFGPLVEKAELARTILDDPIRLGETLVVHKSFALGFEISEEMQDDAQIPFAMDLAGALGKSSRWTAELYGHDVLNNGFANTKYAGRDGQALFSTTHPVQGTGGTIGNRPAADIDLSLAGMEAAWANFQVQTDERGMPIDIMPSRLVVHPSFFLLARRFLETPLYPGGNTNDINPLAGWLTPITSPYLTDLDAWFLLGAPNEIDIRFYWRKAPDTKTWDDDDADGTIHKIKQRHSTMFGDWRGTYGSSGA